MKALLLSTDDIRPGAARAAYRLHQSLRNIGVDSQMLVQSKQSEDSTVNGAKTSLRNINAEARIAVDKLPFLLYPHRLKKQFCLQWLPDTIAGQVARIQPDIVNLHWVCNGYLQIETLAKLNKPIVWTLRDMWPMTGGCHYSENCDRYQHHCGVCPQLQSTATWDASYWVWQRKNRAWRDLNLTIVSLSSWLADCARSSSLFKHRRIETIPNGIDTSLYKPIDRSFARRLLNLPQDKQLVLFGAVGATSDKRKGFHLLQAALQELSHSARQDQIELVVFGAAEPKQPPEFGFKTHYLGKLTDDLSLSLLYGAANVLVAPSVYENLPNTVLEAMACGIPSVAFDIGGMPDLIEHEGTGYLAQPFKIEELAQGIVWVLENDDRYQKLTDRTRQKAEQEFALEIAARRYLSLFNEILTGADQQMLTHSR